MFKAVVVAAVGNRKLMVLLLYNCVTLNQEYGNTKDDIAIS
jgi:hypothetical protein